MASSGKKLRTTPTSSDIARLSGVSRSTVSAVLNDRRRVREGTRQKVLACIREHGYASGMIAKTLAGELSRLVAVLAPNIGSPYHMMFFRGLNQELGCHGYHLMVHSVTAEGHDDAGMVSTLSDYRPAGCVILQDAEGPDACHARMIMEQGIPVVTTAPLAGFDTHFVSYNEQDAMRCATTYALDLGHRRLGYIAGPPFSKSAKNRKLGFFECLIQHGIPMSDTITLDADETAAGGYQAALEMLRDPATRPTVVLCFNDMVAMGVYRAANEMALDIPGDISVIGFDGIDFMELFGPPLTTVDCFPIESGRQAGEILVNAIDNRSRHAYLHRWITPKILERASVKSMTTAPHDNKSLDSLPSGSEDSPSARPSSPAAF